MILRNRRFYLCLIGLLFCVVAILSSGFAQFGAEEQPFLVQRARVIAVEDPRLSPDPYVQGLYIGRQTVEVEIISGEFAGQRVRFENTLSRFFNFPAEAGMELLVSVMPHFETGEISHVDIFGHSRSAFLYILIGLFLLILLVIGRKKGLYSAISLAFTLVTIVFFMIPFILRGHSPVLFAVLAAVLTTIFSTFLVGDISLKSIAAIGGTLVGVVSAGIISVLAGHFARLSGLQLPNAEDVILGAPDGVFIRIHELLFAGIIIAALGAVMDVSMSIASSVFEVKQASPKMNAKKLYRSGMRVGGDIMGTMSNTLILAFAGTSITTLVVIALSEFPYLRLINLDMVGIEIIQGLSASIGLILAVPVTAILASLLASHNKISKFLKTRAKVIEQEQTKAR